MDDKLFWAIKTMLAGKATYPEIAKYFDIGTSTVARVKNAENYDEYLAMIHAMYAKKKKSQAEPEKAPETAKAPEAPAHQVIEHRQNVTVQATHYMESELRKQTETLELISRKLTATLEAVTAMLEIWKNS